MAVTRNATGNSKPRSFPQNGDRPLVKTSHETTGTTIPKKATATAKITKAKAVKVNKSKPRAKKELTTKVTDEEARRFTAAPEEIELDGLLFDLDGTIVDSTDAIEKHWHELGRQLGVDPEEILATSHGRRSIDTLQLYDPKLANWEYISKIEGRIPREFGQNAVLVPGSRSLLARLDGEHAPWMIVTSGTRALVTGWLEVMEMAKPKDMVVAEDVSQGKPDPACYLLGRSRLGLSDKADCLVLEDSPSGVRAGKSAGFRVVAVATTHRIQQLQEAGADWIVRDLRSVTLASWDQALGKLRVLISEAFLD